MPSQSPLLLTVLWLLFCILWAARSLVVRREKRYAIGKKSVDKNNRYKIVSNVAYVAQISLTIPMFWSNSSYLLKFHNNDDLRIAGLLICFVGLIISVLALVYLGRNYSPCFDSHVPFHLITSGPYRFIRHPGWLSKILVGVGGILVSGSWWFAPLLGWLCIEMKRTIQVEEQNLMNVFPEYEAYKKRTYRLIPFLY